MLNKGYEYETWISGGQIGCFWKEDLKLIFKIFKGGGHLFWAGNADN